MPDSRRDQMRQAQWIKRETKRRAAQEQADALTALGVPCAQRSGWVALLDPEGLMARLAHCGCMWCCAHNAPGVIPGEAHARCCGRSPVTTASIVTPQTPTAEAARGALPRTAPPGGDCLPQAVTGPHRAADDVPDFRPDDYPATQWPDEGSRG